MGSLASSIKLLFADLQSIGILSVSRIATARNQGNCGASGGMYQISHEGMRCDNVEFHKLIPTKSQIRVCINDDISTHELNARALVIQNA